MLRRRRQAWNRISPRAAVAARHMKVEMDVLDKAKVPMSNNVALTLANLPVCSGSGDRSNTSV